ncbi:hypothetical protein [Clostridium rectalis]|uniref:hypothetical protein n=1 Tax=Clostridium rectalis TaxID=2040295 RepID=UPI000F62C86A|nr:hypothetical protein [Clostridium rectalis]
MEKEFITQLVQNKLKKVKKLTAALVTITIITSIVNGISIYHYNQLIKKEKVFLQKGEKILLEIETYISE